MKNQTVLEAPEISEMMAAGFKRMGIVKKRLLNQAIENEVPWRKWFLCPIWNGEVEAWYKD